MCSWVVDASAKSGRMHKIFWKAEGYSVFRPWFVGAAGRSWCKLQLQNRPWNLDIWRPEPGLPRVINRQFPPQTTLPLPICWPTLCHPCPHRIEPSWLWVCWQTQVWVLCGSEFYSPPGSGQKPWGTAHKMAWVQEYSWVSIRTPTQSPLHLTSSLFSHLPECHCWSRYLKASGFFPSLPCKQVGPGRKKIMTTCVSVRSKIVYPVFQVNLYPVTLRTWYSYNHCF